MHEHSLGLVGQVGAITMLVCTCAATHWPTEAILDLAIAWLWPSTAGHLVAAPPRHRAAATTAVALPSC